MTKCFTSEVSKVPSLVISVAGQLSSSTEFVPLLKGVSGIDREMKAGRH